jgi:hypothetical protein
VITSYKVLVLSFQIKSRLVLRHEFFLDKTNRSHVAALGCIKNDLKKINSICVIFESDVYVRHLGEITKCLIKSFIRKYSWLPNNQL